MEEKRNIKSVEHKIRGFFRRYRRMPTFEEMVGLFGVRSKSVVNFWINKLIGEGILEKDAKGHLTFSRPALGIPLAGEVTAGFPSPAEEEFCDVLSLDEYVVTQPESSFFLRVTGDSMIGAGIVAGDLVVVEKLRTPKDRDIVIAEVDGEWTMKYFRKDKDNVWLEAANPLYPSIEPKRDLRLGGVVTAVIRKYHA